MFKIAQVQITSVFWHTRVHDFREVRELLHCDYTDFCTVITNFCTKCGDKFFQFHQFLETFVCMYHSNCPRANGAKRRSGRISPGRGLLIVHERSSKSMFMGDGDEIFWYVMTSCSHWSQQYGGLSWMANADWSDLKFVVDHQSRIQLTATI